MVEVLFLDIDGVLNDNSGSRLCADDNVRAFNLLIQRLRSPQIIISSSWRYLLINQEMTLKGFGTLLRTHGVLCSDLLRGYIDGVDWHPCGKCARSELIESWLEQNNPDATALVLDDLDLQFTQPNIRFHRTNGRQGLLERDVVEILYAEGQSVIGR